MYPDCGRNAQSPINIETQSTKYDPSLQPIKPLVVMSLPNYMSLEGLPKKYSAVQLHLHWGSRGTEEGSEHQLNGKTYLAELHVVHFNSESYPNFTVAKEKADGLAVLGILIEVSIAGSENESKNRMKGKSKKNLVLFNFVFSAGDYVSLHSFDVHELLPKQMDKYFRYNGSLTTPPCSQTAGIKPMNNSQWQRATRWLMVAASSLLVTLQGGQQPLVGRQGMVALPV
uniref:Carbonic anhydrase n=1 Tax=Erpetoichthys calabaricus TaxID=27687 RepID=A0A8C4S6N0_ERPCA